jgi:MarR family 2-MHQ and catechol resistance regulon transcriptional repressor
MTYVIGKLSTRRLIERRRCSSDRRVTYVRISPAGRRLMARIFPRHAEAIRRAADGLTAEEKERAADLLKRLGVRAQALL